MSTHMTLDEFCEVVEQVLSELPPPFPAWMENVVVDVEPQASPELLAGLDERTSASQLMGLFVGNAITEQEYGRATPNRIILFQRPIEHSSRSREEVAYEIRRTLLHELGHHFGYSEEELEFFENQPNPFDEE